MLVNGVLLVPTTVHANADGAAEAFDVLSDVAAMAAPIIHSNLEVRQP
jgi:hypothetical protein